MTRTSFWIFHPWSINDTFNFQYSSCCFFCFTFRHEISGIIFDVHDALLICLSHHFVIIWVLFKVFTHTKCGCGRCFVYSLFVVMSLCCNKVSIQCYKTFFIWIPQFVMVLRTFFYSEYTASFASFSGVSRIKNLQRCWVSDSSSLQ